MLIMLEILGGRIREQIPLQNREQNRRRFQDDAHRWFFEKSDFEWWCEVAGFEPEYVREKARKLLESGLPESVMQRQGIRLPSMTAEENRRRLNEYQREYQARKRRDQGVSPHDRIRV